MARVLLTGATGFVGSNLAPLLAAAGHRLRCLVRSRSSAAGLADLGAEWVEGSLEDGGVLAEALRGVDLVVHLAALVSFEKRHRQRMFEVNVEGTRRLARLARQAGVGRFLHMSTVSAVGYADRPICLDESAPYNFARLRIGYCDSKHAAEVAIRDEVCAGLDAVIVNPPTMFGPRDRRKAAGSLLEVVARQQLRFLPPGGVNAADVRDVSRGCLQALAGGRCGERYILGGTNFTNRDLILAIARTAGVAPPRLPLPGWLVRVAAAAATAWESVSPLSPPLTAELLRMIPRFFWYSSQKAADELGYASGPLEPAFRDALTWTVQPRPASAAES